MRALRATLVAAVVLLAGATSALAWENHSAITRATLQSYEGWDPVVYEPIEKALPSLSVNGAPAPTSSSQLAEQLEIHGDKVKWDWQPTAVGGETPSMLDVVAWSSLEPDSGMDQNLNLSPDQKYMGGFEGPSSQAIRHMFYRAWTPMEPLVTFHIPLHEMGLAPARAALYFELARQARKGGHVFWAHRFLGWGLHYVQDLCQPYHTVQFGSFEILPLKVLLGVGWEAFIAETTRIVSNFHLSFEQYVDFLLKPDTDSQLALAFKVPKADEQLKVVLEQKADLGVDMGMRMIAETSSRVAPGLVKAENAFMGKILTDPAMNLVPGFYDGSGHPKIDFNALEHDATLEAPRKTMFDVMERALSNAGVAGRWYVDKFRAATAELPR